METKGTEAEFSPAYNMMSNGQVQTNVLPTMHSSQQYTHEQFSVPQTPQAPLQGQQVPQMSQFPPPPAFSHMPPYPNAYPQYPAQYPTQYPNQYPTQYPQQYPQYPAQYPPQHPPQYPMYYPQPQSNSSRPGLATASLMTFTAGLFTFLPHIVSIIISFVMVKRGYLQGTKKSVVLAFAILELLAWVACASMSWLYINECKTYTEFFSISYTDCRDVYWGWIFVLVWFSFALIFGIARVVIEYGHAKLPTTSPSSSNDYIPLSSPVHHSI